MTESVFLYVGTYTRPFPYLQATHGEGIYIFRFNPVTGELAQVGQVAIDNPSYLVIDHSKRVLYACSEVWEWEEGTITAFAIDSKSGRLTYLNQQPAMGGITVYLSLDKSNRYLLAANYRDGQAVAILPINADGRLAPASSSHKHTEPALKTVPARQDKSHAHCVIADPTNAYVLVCDLGLDKIMIYQLDTENGLLIPNDPPYVQMTPGSGPRHLVFHPNGRFAYVAQELNSTVAVLSFDTATGTFTLLQTHSTLPESYDGHNSCSDIQLTPSGKFLYVGNRGHDSLAIYAIDDDTAALTYIGHQSTNGKTPRNFVIDPTGTYVLVGNQDSDTLVTLRINPHDGTLKPVAVTPCPTPVCLKFIAPS